MIETRSIVVLWGRGSRNYGGLHGEGMDLTQNQNHFLLWWCGLNSILIKDNFCT